MLDLTITGFIGNRQMFDTYLPCHNFWIDGISTEKGVTVGGLDHRIGGMTQSAADSGNGGFYNYEGMSESEVEGVTITSDGGLDRHFYSNSPFESHLNDFRDVTYTPAGAVIDNQSPGRYVNCGFTNCTGIP